MTAFLTAPFASSDVLQAFPLMRQVMPDLDLAGWRKLSRKLLARARAGRGGALCVRGENGYLRGMCIYRIAREKTPRRLIVEAIVALDIIHEGAIADTLVRGIEEAAMRAGCQAIHSRVGTEDEPLLSRLAQAGHEPKMMFTCKPVGCPSRARCGPQVCFQSDCA